MTELKDRAKRKKQTAINAAVILPVSVIILLISYIAYNVFLYPGIVETENELEEEIFMVEAGFDYEVQTSQKTELWPAGTSIPSDELLYFYAIGPVLKVSPYARLVPLQEGTFNAKVTDHVYIGTVDRFNNYFWSEKVKLDLLPEVFVGEFTYDQFYVLNVASLKRRINEVKEDLGLRQRGEDVIEIVLAISVEGKTSEPFLKEYEKSLFCTLDREGFYVTPSKNLGFQENAVLKKVEHSKRRKTLLESLASQTNYIYITGLVIFAWIGFSLRSRRNAQHSSYYRFKEWISEGIVPLEGKTVIAVKSLEGLVDLAIDMNKRVIRNQKAMLLEAEGGMVQNEEYYVLDGNIVYKYRAEKS